MVNARKRFTTQRFFLEFSQPAGGYQEALQMKSKIERVLKEEALNRQKEEELATISGILQ